MNIFSCKQAARENTERTHAEPSTSTCRSLLIYPRIPIYSQPANASGKTVPLTFSAFPLCPATHIHHTLQPLAGTILRHIVSLYKHPYAHAWLPIRKLFTYSPRSTLLDCKHHAYAPPVTNPHNQPQNKMQHARFNGRRSRNTPQHEHGPHAEDLHTILNSNAQAQGPNAMMHSSFLPTRRQPSHTITRFPIYDYHHRYVLSCTQIWRDIVDEMRANPKKQTYHSPHICHDHLHLLTARHRLMQNYTLCSLCLLPLLNYSQSSYPASTSRTDSPCYITQLYEAPDAHARLPTKKLQTQTRLPQHPSHSLTPGKRTTCHRSTQMTPIYHVKNTSPPFKLMPDRKHEPFPHAQDLHTVATSNE